MLKFKSFPIYSEVRNFIIDCYKLAYKFPRQEQFELSSQLRRAATSILLNIAEGAARKSDPELRRFLLIAVGSASEITAILDITLDQRYISAQTHQEFSYKCESIIKQLYGFSRKLKS